MSYIQPHMVEALKDHALEEILGPGDGRAFLMRRPGEWDMHLYLVFFRECIILTGDLAFGTRNGCISDMKYDLQWFIGNAGGDYLCSKFLDKKWQPEIASELMADWLVSDKDLTAEQREVVEEALEELDSDGMGSERLWHALVNAEIDVSDGVPGTDYPRADAGWLCAVQQRFRDLYRAQFQPKEST